jgi:prepilin-type N-terminal cleavage/methylation domain-containing protein
LPNKRLAAARGGFSLVETLIATAIGSLLLFLAATILVFSFRQTAASAGDSQALVDRSLFEYQLQKAVDASIVGPIWLNQQIAGLLSVNWTLGPVAILAPMGSVAVNANSVVSGATVIADPTSKFDVVNLIQMASGAAGVTIAPSAAGSPGYPGYLLTPTQTAATFNVSGSTAAYAVGSIVAIGLTSGAQFATITAVTPATLSLDWSAMGTFTINGAVQNWPALYLAPGTTVYVATMSLIGQDSTDNFIALWNLNVAAGTLQLAQKQKYQVKSLKVADSNGTPSGTGFFLAHDSGFEIFSVFSMLSSGIAKTINLQVVL